MAQGFIKNRTTPTVADVTWSNAIELTGTSVGDAGHDARSRKLPSAAHLSHIEIIFTGVSHSTTLTFEMRVTYDEAGREPILPPLSAQRTRNARVSTSNTKLLVLILVALDLQRLQVLCGQTVQMRRLIVCFYQSKHSRW